MNLSIDSQEALKAKMKEKDTRIRELEEQNKKFLEKMQKYRGMLTDIKEDVFPGKLDVEVVNAFRDLKDEVNHLVRQFYDWEVKSPFNIIIDHRPRTILREIAKINLHDPLRRFKIRGIIYLYLAQRFFSKPAFGLHSQTREAELSRIEDDSTLTTKENVYWRHLTMKNISSATQIQSEVQAKLEIDVEHMDHDLTDYTKPGLKREAKDAIRAIIQSAFNFSMMFRQQKHHFEVFHHSPGEIAHPDEIVDYGDFGTVASGPLQPITTSVHKVEKVGVEIECVIWGGLRKGRDKKGGRIQLVEEDVYTRRSPGEVENGAASSTNQEPGTITQPTDQEPGIIKQADLFQNYPRLRSIAKPYDRSNFMTPLDNSVIPHKLFQTDPRLQSTAKKYDQLEGMGSATPPGFFQTDSRLPSPIERYIKSDKDSGIVPS